MKVLTEREQSTFIITINRPEVRNAIDTETASLLADAFRTFEADDELRVAILTGAGDDFSAGVDLKALARGEKMRIQEDGDSVMGPTRMRMRKPVIAAVSGYALAGGMALAVWCDLRVADRSATFGMPDRKVGVPILGGVTTTLPQQIGLSHALDIILTGRMVGAEEAHRMGLANRLVDDGTSLDEAKLLAEELASFPWQCLVTDRMNVLENLDLPRESADRNEFRQGKLVFRSAEYQAGPAAFANRSKDADA